MSLMEYIIVALGDSLTYGYPYSPGSSWVSLAAEELALTIYNRGGVNGGETSLEMQARLESDVLALKPDAVIVWQAVMMLSDCVRLLPGTGLGRHCRRWLAA